MRDTVCPPELTNKILPDCDTMFVNVSVKFPEGVHLKLFTSNHIKRTIVVCCKCTCILLTVPFAFTICSKT